MHTIPLSFPAFSTPFSPTHRQLYTTHYTKCNSKLTHNTSERLHGTLGRFITPAKKECESKISFISSSWPTTTPVQRNCFFLLAYLLEQSSDPVDDSAVFRNDRSVQWALGEHQGIQVTGRLHWAVDSCGQSTKVKT